MSTVNRPNNIQQLKQTIPVATGSDKIENVTIDTMKWNDFKAKLNVYKEKSKEQPLSMSVLLELLGEIIQASLGLRQKIMVSRVDEAETIAKLAVRLADKKQKDATFKFGISLASSVVNMALTTASTIKMGRTESLTDEHVDKMTQGRFTKVSDLEDAHMQQLTANLQQLNTQKWSSMSRMSDMSNNMVGHVNEIQYSERVRTQELIQAANRLNDQYNSQLDQYIGTLSQQALKLNDILDAIRKASLATNR